MSERVNRLRGEVTGSPVTSARRSSRRQDRHRRRRRDRHDQSARHQRPGPGFRRRPPRGVRTEQRRRCRVRRGCWGSSTSRLDPIARRDLRTARRCRSRSTSPSTRSAAQTLRAPPRWTSTRCRPRCRPRSPARRRATRSSPTTAAADRLDRPHAPRRGADGGRPGRAGRRAHQPRRGPRRLDPAKITTTLNSGGRSRSTPAATARPDRRAGHERPRPGVRPRPPPGVREHNDDGVAVKAQLLGFKAFVLTPRSARRDVRDARALPLEVDLAVARSAARQVAADGDAGHRSVPPRCRRRSPARPRATRSSPTSAAARRLDRRDVRAKS